MSNFMSMRKVINKANVRTRYSNIRIRSRNSCLRMFMTNGGLPPSGGYCEYNRDILSIMWQKHMYSATSNRDTPTFWSLVIILWTRLNIRRERMRTETRLGFHSTQGRFQQILFLFMTFHHWDNLSLFNRIREPYTLLYIYI